MSCDVRECLKASFESLAHPKMDLFTLISDLSKLGLLILGRSPNNSQPGATCFISKVQIHFLLLNRIWFAGFMQINVQFEENSMFNLTFDRGHWSK